MKKFNKHLFFSPLSLSVLAVLFASTLSAQTWERLSDSPFYKHHSNGYGHEGKAYIFEGILNSRDVSNRLWEYTPETDTWVRLPDFPGPARAIAIGDDWEGKYYYGFGDGVNGRLNDLWVFDPVDTSFTQLPSCPCIGRTHPSLIAHNDKVYMGAGSSSNGDLRDWWIYDINTQQWTQGPNIPGTRRHHTFHFSSGDDVYVGGGHVFNWLKYDTNTGEWSEIDNTPLGRVAGTQLNYKGDGLIVAGDDYLHDHVPNFETFMRYSTQTDEWEYLPPLPNGSRWAPSSFIIDDQLYFFGGLSSNINNDVSVWKFDLNFLSCLPATDLKALNVDSTSADLFWITNDNGVSDTLKWRKEGETVWNVVPDAEATYVLDGLEACQEYEFQITSSCDSLNSISSTIQFRTLGCCSNPALALGSVTNSRATVSWMGTEFATNYTVRWRELGQSSWSERSTRANSYRINNLDGCTEYECQIRTNCSNEDSDFGESLVFWTKDCGVCMDEEYCQVSQNLSGQAAFINKIEINGFVNSTGSDGGYGNFVLPEPEEINIGESFTLVVEPGFQSDKISSDLKVWVDLNLDGEFTEDEILVEEAQVDASWTGEVEIPNTASAGLSRIRIVYASGASVTACQDANNQPIGEAEDYCIRLGATTNTTQPEVAVSLFASPNPFANVVQVNATGAVLGTFSAQIVNLTGAVVWQDQNYELGQGIDLSSLATGVYFLRLENDSILQTIKLTKQ
ncbi:MAG: kelch repeat-containing protein [Bacteroidota bacterium]